MNRNSDSEQTIEHADINMIKGAGFWYGIYCHVTQDTAADENI